MRYQYFANSSSGAHSKISTAHFPFTSVHSPCVPLTKPACRRQYVRMDFRPIKKKERFCITVDGRNLAPLCTIACVHSLLPPSPPGFNIGRARILTLSDFLGELNFQQRNLLSILRQGVTGDGKGNAFNQHLPPFEGGARFRPSTVGVVQMEAERPEVW